MSNAIGYVLTNFVWFAQLISSFFTEKYSHNSFAAWAALGAIGIFAFPLGVLLTTIQANRRPYFILSSILLSMIVVAFSGAFRGKLDGSSTSMLLWGITGLQAVIAIGTLYWARNGRAATVLMVPLCASFWLWSELDAAMSFQDVWL